MAIKKVLIANRGEIAVRIIRSARELGIKTVQVVSAADTDMLAARMADETIDIGPAPAAKSYLDQASLLAALAKSEADALHPGYGFLSENAEFAEAVTAAGVTFIGPSAATIRQMGDKANARAQAIAVGVPVVPGSTGRVSDTAAALVEAARIGFPVMIKAAAGGGGRGIRIARNAADIEVMIPQARTEAQAGFGDGGLYLEAFIENARHVEVQILGDGTRAVHLFERECSVQRRRQKVWEEAPATMLPEDLRAVLCASAVRLAKAVGYKGAGTLEYLYDASRRAFYFIEMNTRIQVEHPVTEMITGIDLIREMFLIAGGQPLRLQQADIQCRGHAIEVRVNAEDPAKGFRPSPGLITEMVVPGGPWVRFDTFIYEGYKVPAYYDSLLGKLVVWDENRDAALARMTHALDDMHVGPLATTLTLHRKLVRDPELRRGEVSTTWLETWLEQRPLL